MREYMRNYQRRRRGVKQLVLNNLPGEPTKVSKVWYDADGNPVYED